MSGVVSEVWICSAAGADLVSVGEARLLVGQGIEGDRYALGVGSFSRWPGTGRAVTLIEAEVIDDVLARHGLDLTGGRSRRNLVTRGLRLNDLVGRRFRLGTALFRGERLAQP